MTTAGTGLSDAAFQAILDKVRSAVERIQRKVRELFDTVHDVISAIPDILVPDGLVQKVNELLARVQALIGKFLSKIWEHLTSPGLPSALRATGDQWSADVGGIVRSTGDEVGTAKMHVGDYWRGNAAVAYRDTLNRQGPALDSMSQLTRDIDEWLGNAAAAIEEFWQSVAIAAVALAAGVVTCIGACATGVGAPAGIIALIAGILTAIGAVLGGYNSAENQYNDVANAINAMKMEATQNATFSQGWPAATASGTWKAD